MGDFRAGPSHIRERLAEQRPMGAVSASAENRPRVFHRQGTSRPGKILLEEFHRSLPLGQARRQPASVKRRRMLDVDWLWRPSFYGYARMWNSPASAACGAFAGEPSSRVTV